MAKLSVRDLWKSFGTHEVLRGISLDVGEGQMVCLIGASGSGKSTLLRCLNLLEPVDDGTIQLDGQDITALRPDQRFARGLARTFQIPQEFAQIKPLPNH